MILRMDNKLDRIGKEMRERQAAAESPEQQTKAREEFEALSPSEKLSQLRLVISGILRKKFLETEQSERTAIMAEYNGLVDQCHASGDNTAIRIDSEELFAQLFHNPVRLDLTKLREQVKAAEMNEQSGVAQILQDLRGVGPSKPLGYLPLDSITYDCAMRVQDLKKELEDSGLKVLELRAPDTEIESGALYAYDDQALRDLLMRNRDILAAENWPTEPEAFILKLKTWIDTKTPLYDIIADAFGDTTNPGRTNPETSGRVQ
jgi:hypothetical protein